MGKLVEYRYVVECNGWVAAKPLADMESAMSIADEFVRDDVKVSIACYWSGTRLWEHAHASRRIAG